MDHIKLGKIQRLHILRRQGGRRTVSAEITDRGSSRCDLGFEHEPGHVSVGAKDLIRRDPKFYFLFIGFILKNTEIVRYIPILKAPIQNSMNCWHTSKWKNTLEMIHEAQQQGKLLGDARREPAVHGDEGRSGVHDMFKQNKTALFKRKERLLWSC